MKLQVLLGVLCALLLADGFDTKTYTQSIWKTWKYMFHKMFSSIREDVRRMRIFASNLQFIRIHNQRYRKGLEPYAMRLNQFSAMTPDEFKAIYLTSLRTPSDKEFSTVRYFNPRVFPLPERVDWREYGYVTKVKDQGSCGSCWAFSTTGAVEGALKKKMDILYNISEQQLVDCSGSFGTHGCNGGWMEFAFQYLIQNGPELEKDYPYVGKERTCDFSESKVIGNITNYLNVLKNSEEQLQLAVAHNGPVAVAVNANGFASYSHGIYKVTECDRTTLNHAVLVVGYGTQKGEDYWIVKNSWGRHWGMDGYILMARNYDNMCGIAAAASYPLA